KNLAALRANTKHATVAQVDAAKMADKQATALMILGRVQAKYGGDTKTYSNSAAGAVSNMKNAMDVLDRTIGQKLLPILTTLVKFISQMILKHKTLVLIILGAATAHGVFVGAMK